VPVNTARDQELDSLLESIRETKVAAAAMFPHSNQCALCGYAHSLKLFVCSPTERVVIGRRWWFWRIPCRIAGVHVHVRCGSGYGCGCTYLRQLPKTALAAFEEEVGR
jgi:hypothetical protein